MSGRRYAIFVGGIFFGLVTAVYLITYIATAGSSKEDCIDRYEVCVETTDGWKPYRESP